MMTRMQEREQKCDAHHEDDMLWGAGTTNMIAKTINEVGQGDKGREREREITARTDGVELEAFQYTAMTREEGPEEHQQLQQQLKPKLQLKLQPRPQPAPKPKLALIAARLCQTVPPCAKSQRAAVGSGPAPMAGLSMAERLLILRRDARVLQ
jgi:hypothetical protein